MENLSLYLLAVSAKNVYTACLVGNPAPIVATLYEQVKNPRVGDMVLEVSSYFCIEREWQKCKGVSHAKKAIGRLLKIEKDDELGITYELELLDGSKMLWSNCMFIRILETANF